MVSVKFDNPPAAPTKRKIPGEEGVWILILGDMCVFAIFFGTFLFYRGQQPELFASAQETLNRNLGALNTIILLFSSLFVILASSSLRQGNTPKSRTFLRWAMLCGLGFIAVKIVEYHEKLSIGITPSTNSFFTYYFILTAVHLFHLIIGLLVLVAIYALLKKPPVTPRRLALFEGGACFWHMVDLLWIVLFPLIFLVR